MTVKFYATNHYFNIRVAIFRTEAERDLWVEYKDESSIRYRITREEERGDERVKITYEEACSIVGENALYDESGYEFDEYDNRIRWVCKHPSYMGHVPWEEIAVMSTDFRQNDEVT